MKEKYKKIEILLVLANARIHKLKFGPINISFREAPLTATTLAALVPDDIDANITICDESVDIIPLNGNFDLVGISLITGTATRAYEIANFFRNRGITVVLGGVHVTLMPEEAKKHADTVVIGFAEKTWPLLVKDFVSGKLKPVYRDTDSDISNMPIPRRDLQKRFGYMTPNTVMVTRGCRSKCDFCSVPVAGFGWHKRPMGDVINEIKQIKANRIAITDVHLTQDHDYAKELFKAMIPLKKTWGGLSSVSIVDDDELLDTMMESGCRLILLGFESLNNDSLSGIHKSFNKVEEYETVIQKLHDRNIMVMGCFIFGFDEDDISVFDKTVDFINRMKIEIPRYAILTPYPKTPAFKKLHSKGRILHKQWEYYDTQHVVFVPNKMSPKELDNGFKYSHEKTFTLKNNLLRTFGSGENFYATFLGNLAYQIFIRRLNRDLNRFPDGCAL